MTDGVATRVAADGDLVAVANRFDTPLYDLADAAAPRLVGIEEAWSSSMSVALEDDVLYVGDWDWLRTYSIDALVGGPDASTPHSLSIYGGVGALRATFQLENLGDRTLDATLACSDPRLTVTPAATVEPGEQELIELNITTIDAGYQQVDCAITSNDPGESYREFLVEINPLGLEVGDPAPDWTLPDLDGAMHSLSALRDEVVLITLWSGL